MRFRFENVVRSWRPLLRGAYPAVVTSLAAALLVLLLWPQSQRTYVAEAIAAANAPIDESAEGNITAWLASSEVLRAAVTSLRASHQREIEEFLGGSGVDPLAVLQERLTLIPLASPGEPPRLSIACQGPRRRAALAIAQELAQQLAEHQPAHARHRRLTGIADRQRQASAELKDAQGTAERLQVELQGLRHAQLTSVAASAPATTNAAAAAAPASDLATSELSRTLAALKLERDRLLEVYLPAHPQIQTLSAQISRLEESLRRASPKPEHRGAVHPAGGQRNGGSTVLLEWQRDFRDVQASGTSPLPAPADTRTDLASAIRQTQLELLAVTHRRQKAEQACQSLADERRKIETDSEVAWQIQPARITSTSGASPQRQWAAALIAATAGGMGIGWLASRNQRLTTAAELRASVALPVLATMASPESEPLADDGPSRTQAAVQLTTRGAEVVLATFVLTLALAVALDSGLFADLTHDPLTTIGELLQRLI